MQNLRPPIVVILGHVDHGKTSLLDAIRGFDTTLKEFGGITQKIGAFQESGITFIDTPGHEAFTKMRSRGATVADIAVLVVAANDSVMPQTVESIKIIKEAKIPYIVAINKIDLPEANVDKVIQDLLRHEVLLENYGGDVQFIKVSATKKTGIKDLLDLIQLLSEVKEISGDPEAALEFAVIESSLSKSRGPVATLIIRNGSLRIGQEIEIDAVKSKIRALIDYQGKNISEATPGMPVEVLGLSQIPQIGSTITKTEIKEGQLNLILKTDTLGSMEAITGKIPENVNLIDISTGDISEKDVLLAKSTKAIILGFNVKASSSTLKLAQTEKVLIRTYKIIYKLLEELQDAAEGVLLDSQPEEVMGTGQILAIFPYEKMLVAGVKITDGRMAKGDLVKIKTQTSKIKSVRIGKEEVNKVEVGKECGLLFEPQIDFRPGDDIIAYRVR